MSGEIARPHQLQETRLMAKFSEHYSPGIETGEGEGLSKMPEKRKS